MLVQDDLQKVEQIKKNIHTSIKNKEVNIPNDTPFEDYPSKIDSITGGGTGYSYSNFSGNVVTPQNSVAYADTTITDKILPNYTLYKGDESEQYCLMPASNQKYKKVKVQALNPYLNVVGVNFENGVASNFNSNARYVEINREPFCPEGNWSLQLKFTTGDSSPEWQYLIAPEVDLTGGLILCIHYGRQLTCWLGNTTGSWFVNEGIYSPDVLTTNTTYWVQMLFDGNTYTVKLSTDGENFSTVISYSNSTKIKSFSTRWLGAGCSNYPFLGSIDLNDTYFMDGSETYFSYPQTDYVEKDVNGCLMYEDDGSAKTADVYNLHSQDSDKLVLSEGVPSIVGVTATKLGTLSVPAHDLYTYEDIITKVDHVPDELTVVGNPTINGPVVGGFSYYNYLLYPQSFNKVVSSLDIQMKYRVGSNQTSYGRLFNDTGSYDDVELNAICSEHINQALILAYTNYMFTFSQLTASVGDDLTMRFYTENGKLKMKYKINNGDWVDYSENGVVKEQDWSHLQISFSGLSFGYRIYNHDDNTRVDGDIDFSECYIKFDDEYILSGMMEDVIWTKK